MKHTKTRTRCRTWAVSTGLLVITLPLGAEEITYKTDVEIEGHLNVRSDVLIEKDLTVAEALRIGQSTNPLAGTIRSTGSDFEGYTGIKWVSLTRADGP